MAGNSGALPFVDIYTRKDLGVRSKQIEIGVLDQNDYIVGHDFLANDSN